MSLASLRTRSAIAALLLSTLALTSCGESAQEKAKAQVCGARTDISKQITALEGLTLSTNVLTEAKQHFEAIGDDLTKIKDAQPNLEPARREQVESATKTFKTELETISSGLVTSLKSGSPQALAGAEPKLKAALTQLASSYRQALAPISCS